MLNFKNSALVSVFLMGMTISTGVNASANATVIWSGSVPATNASDAIVITGLSGDTTALNGTITPQTDGVFQSDSIILEAHVNDAILPGVDYVVGELTPATWTLVDASVTYDGVAHESQIIEVEVNGAPVTTGDSVPSVSTITTKISQTASLPEEEIGGSTVQATITVMADLV